MKINPNQSKYNYMLESSRNHMDSIALTFGNRKITYEELFESIEKYSKMLYAKGVRKGDYVGVFLLNTPESVYLLYALNYIGAVVIGYSPFDNREKIKKDIEMTKPKMIITADFSYGNFKNLDKSLNFSTIIYSPMSSIDDLKLKTLYNLLQLKNGNIILEKEKKGTHNA